MIALSPANRNDYLRTEDKNTQETEEMGKNTQASLQTLRRAKETQKRLISNFSTLFHILRRITQIRHKVVNILD